MEECSGELATTRVYKVIRPSVSNQTSVLWALILVVESERCKTQHDKSFMTSLTRVFIRSERITLVLLKSWTVIYRGMTILKKMLLHDKDHSFPSIKKKE